MTNGVGSHTSWMVRGRGGQSEQRIGGRVVSVNITVKQPTHHHHIYFSFRWSWRLEESLHCGSKGAVWWRLLAEDEEHNITVPNWDLDTNVQYITHTAV